MHVCTPFKWVTPIMLATPSLWQVILSEVRATRDQSGEHSRSKCPKQNREGVRRKFGDGTHHDTRPGVGRHEKATGSGLRNCNY